MKDFEDKIEPCPMCGHSSPFTYISFNCAVLRCECGVGVLKGAATVMYKRDELPDDLIPYSYEPKLLKIKQKDGTILDYPDHGYIGVSALAAFHYEGVLQKWNRRKDAPDCSGDLILQEDGKCKIGL